MATTTITEASFQLACAECADAIDSSDWATARTKYAKAEVIHAGLQAQAGHSGTFIRRRETLKGIREALEFVETSVSAVADTRRLVMTTLRF